MLNTLGEVLNNYDFVSRGVAFLGLISVGGGVPLSVYTGNRELDIAAVFVGLTFGTLSLGLKSSSDIYYNSYKKAALLLEKRQHQMHNWEI